MVAGVLFRLQTSSIVSSSSHNTILKCIKAMINIVVLQGLKQNDLDFMCNIVYNYVVISQCMDRSNKPPGRYYSYHSVITIISPYPYTFKVIVLTHTYLQLLITKFVHTNTFLDKGSSTREQALWEINKF